MQNCNLAQANPYDCEVVIWTMKGEMEAEDEDVN
jgi:hypothetical protein